MSTADRSASGRRALVLGGSGFLGGHVVTALRQGGWDVRTASRRPSAEARHTRLDLLADGPQLFAAAIAADPPDVIVNCVGSTAGGAREMVDTNAVAPARLLDLVALAAPRARVVHLGSGGEYGAVPAGRPISEDTPENPVSAYGLTKLAGTRLLLRAAADGGVDVVVLRVFNPIGPGSPASSLPGRTAMAIREALRRGAGTGITTAPLDSFRDWVDVRDVAAAVIAAARPEPLPGRLYNIGSGRAVLARDVVGALARTAGFDASVHETRRPPARSDTVTWQQADIARARAQLGWFPRCGLEDSIAQVWRAGR